MPKLIKIFATAITLISLFGCSNNERPSLASYDNIISETDIKETIAYSGIIEKSITKNPDGSGIHFSFGTEGFISQKGRKGSAIFIAHIEYLATKKDELISDMKDNEPISASIGDYAWYGKISDGHHHIIFYIEDKNIIVEIWGYDYDTSTFINKEGLIKLAHLIENKL